MLCGVVALIFSPAGLLGDDAASTNGVATSPPVYVPDMTHSGDPLPDGVLAWNSLMQTTNAAADKEQAHFVFCLTNISSGNVTIVTAPRPSCGCTTTEVPPIPWTIPPGGNGEIGATVNLQGRTGTMVKSVTVSTDKGSKDLYMQITVLPPVIRVLTDAERAHGVEIAKSDRQAVFKDDCATCHAKPGTGKYGKVLYDAVCGICHEGEQRATMVPDLHNLKTTTNDEFWRTWIAHGKPGSLMPAFAIAEGGPLNDMQIATIAAYLNMTIPSQSAPVLTNAPAN